METEDHMSSEQDEVEKENVEDSDEEDFDGIDSESSEEDVDSDGEPDEEVEAEVAKLLEKWKARQELEKNTPGPSGINVHAPVDEEDQEMEERTSPVGDVKDSGSPQREKEKSRDEDTSPFVFLSADDLEPPTNLTDGEHLRPIAISANVTLAQLEKLATRISQGISHPSAPRRVSITRLRDMEANQPLEPPLRHFILRPVANSPNEPVEYVMEHDRKMFNRAVPRNPLVEAPNIMEVIEENHYKYSPHPRADQYPKDWCRAMVDYAEDRFWTERIVPIPEGVKIPPRPRDYWVFEDKTPPPEDYDWVPPAGTPPIFIPPEAHALFEERKQEHFRQLDESEDNNRRH